MPQFLPTTKVVGFLAENIMKLQYKSESLVIKTAKRRLLYRIDPSELSWWKRTFKNPWRYVYTAYRHVSYLDDNVNDCLKFLFTTNEAHDIIEKYDTYEKLICFLNIEYNKALERYHKAQEKYKKENSWKI